MLTGGIVDDSVRRLVAGLGDAGVPVLAVQSDTYETVSTVGSVRGAIGPNSERKIATAIRQFEDHVDHQLLRERLAVARPTRVTPLMFEQTLLERARTDRRHIVLPEGRDDRILAAAEQLLLRGVADLTVLGDPDEVRARATALGLGLPGVTVIDPTTSEHRERFAEVYAQLRKHKGVAPLQAYDVMADVSYFGTMMIHQGLADGMVSGAAHTTAHTIRPAFEFIRTAPGVSLVSSAFLMCLADRVLVYADCAVVPKPDAGQLADIAVSAAATATLFDIEPRVAMLSYSTGQSGSGSDDRDEVGRARGHGQAEVAPGEGRGRPGQRGRDADPDARQAPVPGTRPTRHQPGESGEQQQARADGHARAGSPGAEVWNDGLQREADRREGTGLGSGRADCQAEDGRQRSDIPGAELVPDTGRAPSRPAHRGAEEQAARKSGHERKRKRGPMGEVGPEDRRQQDELDRHRQGQRLELRRLAGERGAEPGVHAEGPALGPVAERGSHPERGEGAESRHGVSPTLRGRPRARHSDTPSSSTTARYPRARSFSTASGARTQYGPRQ